MNLLTHPTTVESETTRTMAAAAAASCENESSQVRLAHPAQDLRAGVGAGLPAPASIMFLIRSRNS